MHATWSKEYVCAVCLQRIPQRIVEKAIRGMMPSGRIGNSLFTHLKVLLLAHDSHTLLHVMFPHEGNARNHLLLYK